LIEKIATIDAIKRIRYTTSHPLDMNDQLIEAHRDIEKLMPFLHLPVQSGSNKILQAMNRKHHREDYFRIIDKLRTARPDIGLSSDFIVGFPGESDQDFLDTIDLVEKIGFTQCYSFKYSPRIGTPSADAKNQIDESIKEERLSILQALLTKQQIAFNDKFQGKILNVLFEKEAPKSTKNSQDNYQNIINKKPDQSRPKRQLWGKSEYLQSVVVDLADDINLENYFGKICPVTIEKSRPSSLVGKII
jgi:tRNA-2-methylthio-N6-dimethylallyladenosine synthase